MIKQKVDPRQRRGGRGEVGGVIGFSAARVNRLSPARPASVTKFTLLDGKFRKCLKFDGRTFPGARLWYEVTYERTRENDFRARIAVCGAHRSRHRHPEARADAQFRGPRAGRCQDEI